MEIEISDIKVILGTLCAAIGGLWVFVANAFKQTATQHHECQKSLKRLYERLIETGQVRDLRARQDPIDFEDRRE